jgi:hypothetical protein
LLVFVILNRLRVSVCQPFAALLRFDGLAVAQPSITGGEAQFPCPLTISTRRRRCCHASQLVPEGLIVSHQLFFHEPAEA